MYESIGDWTSYPRLVDVVKRVYGSLVRAWSFLSCRPDMRSNDLHDPVTVWFMYLISWYSWSTPSLAFLCTLYSDSTRFQWRQVPMEEGPHLHCANIRTDSLCIWTSSKILAKCHWPTFLIIYEMAVKFAWRVASFSLMCLYAGQLHSMFFALDLSFTYCANSFSSR